MFDVCKKLLAVPPGKPDTTDAVYRSSLIEAGLPVQDSRSVHSRLPAAGWLLMASLIGLGAEWIGSRLTPMLTLWQNCLGKNPKTASKDQLLLDLRQRAAALLALRSLVHVFTLKNRMSLLPNGQVCAVS